MADQTAIDVNAEWRAFADEVGVVFLATQSESGPVASYAPFVRDASGDLFILISGLAAHHQNLLDSPAAGALIAESPDAAANAFALKRLQLQVRAEPVPRDEDARHDAIALLRRRFGKFVDTLDGLGDFTLFRLVPESGTYVRGFAQTWQLSGAGLAVATPVGPRQASDD